MADRQIRVGGAERRCLVFLFHKRAVLCRYPLSDNVSIDGGFDTAGVGEMLVDAVEESDYSYDDELSGDGSSVTAQFLTPSSDQPTSSSSEYTFSGSQTSNESDVERVVSQDNDGTQVDLRHVTTGERDYREKRYHRPPDVVPTPDTTVQRARNQNTILGVSEAALAYMLMSPMVANSSTGEGECVTVQIGAATLFVYPLTKRCAPSNGAAPSSPRAPPSSIDPALDDPSHWDLATDEDSSGSERDLAFESQSTRLVVAMNHLDNKQGTITMFTSCFVRALEREERREHYLSSQVDELLACRASREDNGANDEKVKRTQIFGEISSLARQISGQSVELLGADNPARARRSAAQFLSVNGLRIPTSYLGLGASEAWRSFEQGHRRCVLATTRHMFPPEWTFVLNPPAHILFRGDATCFVEDAIGPHYGRVLGSSGVGALPLDTVRRMLLYGMGPPPHTVGRLVRQLRDTMNGTGSQPERHGTNVGSETTPKGPTDSADALFFVAQVVELLARTGVIVLSRPEIAFTGADITPVAQIPIAYQQSLLPSTTLFHFRECGSELPFCLLGEGDCNICASIRSTFSSPRRSLQRPLPALPLDYRNAQDEKSAIRNWWLNPPPIQLTTLLDAFEDTHSRFQGISSQFRVETFEDLFLAKDITDGAAATVEMLLDKNISSELQQFTAFRAFSAANSIECQRRVYASCSQLSCVLKASRVEVMRAGTPPTVSTDGATVDDPHTQDPDSISAGATFLGADRSWLTAHPSLRVMTPPVGPGGDLQVAQVAGRVPLLNAHTLPYPVALYITSIAMMQLLWGGQSGTLRDILSFLRMHLRRAQQAFRKTKTVLECVKKGVESASGYILRGSFPMSPLLSFVVSAYSTDHVARSCVRDAERELVDELFDNLVCGYKSPHILFTCQRLSELITSFAKTRITDTEQVKDGLFDPIEEKVEDTSLVPDELLRDVALLRYIYNVLGVSPGMLRAYSGTHVYAEGHRNDAQRARRNAGYDLLLAHHTLNLFSDVFYIRPTRVTVGVENESV